MIAGIIIGGVLLTVAVLYVILILPRTSHGADMELVTTDYAHRGLWDAANPENSLAAFALALKHGYGIELDVHLSSDGELMVFHDYSLKRMCGIDKNISDLTCAQLKSIRLGNSTQTIPTLNEVLALVRGRVPLLIEVKCEGMNEPLCRKLAERMDTYSGAFAVQSFSPLIIRWFSQYRPTFARGQLMQKLTKKNQPKLHPLLRFALSNLLLNVITRPDFMSVSVAQRRSLSFVIGTKVFGARGFIWTVRSKEDYVAARKDGHNAIFEGIRPKAK